MRGKQINILAKEKETPKSTFDVFVVCIWILTLIMFIAGICTKDKNKWGLYLSSGIFYAIYVWYAWTKAPIAKFLANISSDSNIEDVIKRFCQSGVEIKIKGECFHYRRSGRGGRTKVITHKDSEVFPIFSTLDVSGTFKLDTASTKKGFIRLGLERVIQFADEISVSDYFNFRNNFTERNKNRDDSFTCIDKRKIIGMTKYQLVKVGDAKSLILINKYVYLIFIIIFLPFVYNIIFILCCHKQTFTIRKLVSTRFDLSQSKYYLDPKYNSLIPSVDLGNKQINFERTNTVQIHDQVRVYDLPTEEELQAAEAFSSYVPNYRFDSFGNALLDCAPTANVFDQPFESQPAVAVAVPTPNYDLSRSSNSSNSSNIPVIREKLVDKPK